MDTTGTEHGWGLDRGQAHSLATMRQDSEGSHMRNILSESQPREHTCECAESSPRSVTSESPEPGRQGARDWKKGRIGQAAVGEISMGRASGPHGQPSLDA